MKQMIINIPDMQSAHCQARVNNAVKEIDGVQIQNVEAGKIAISIASDNTKNEVVKAIEKAGYSVSSESSNNDSDCATGCCNN
ncbi:MAG: heavy-metal-associated domain-containing protein [Flavobacterium lindanitolerans]|jgi:copper chaperone|uniref:heavy-metal-associated domain-containing protein n=1 Tax=Flavobacterium TaxID=237 RepID=UPI0006F611E3|nr:MULTISPECIES: heavy-metal-associated domain-containing protein [Flavobacterium]KQS47178.1 hypothetical protein ASG38_06875 [Flavobacterium sp. Leaf359]MBL7869547.1 heavy-metal-associated domain-containing protein [Flavobacterium lindanitolerans]